jgi:hypothetical protein
MDGIPMLLLKMLLQVYTCLSFFIFLGSISCQVDLVLGSRCYEVAHAPYHV